MNLNLIGNNYSAFLSQERENVNFHHLIQNIGVVDPDPDPDPDPVGSGLFWSPGSGSGSGKIPDPDQDPLSTKRPHVIKIFLL